MLERGERAHAPAGEELRAQQILREPRGALGFHDAGEQQLAGVGAAHAARLLHAVERERISADVVTPERGVEALGEPRRLLFEFDGPAGMTELARAFRREQLGHVDIALYLGE